MFYNAEQAVEVMESKFDLSVYTVIRLSLNEQRNDVTNFITHRLYFVMLNKECYKNYKKKIEQIKKI